MKIVFVCTGNTCRSPMAQAILQNLADFQKWNISCDSAGLFASGGSPMSEGARHALAVVFKITDFYHSSRPLTQRMFDEADLIVGMTMGHKNAIEERFGKSEKVIVMPADIGDPYGGGSDTYEDSARDIMRGIDRLLQEGVIHG